MPTIAIALASKATTRIERDINGGFKKNFKVSRVNNKSLS